MRYTFDDKIELLATRAEICSYFSLNTCIYIHIYVTYMHSIYKAGSRNLFQTRLSRLQLTQKAQQQKSTKMSHAIYCKKKYYKKKTKICFVA